MSGSDHSWADSAVQWVLEGHSQQLPGTLSDCLSGATGAELAELLSQLLDQAVGSLAFETSDEAASETGSGTPGGAGGLSAGGALVRLRSLLQLAAARALSLRLSQEAELTASIEPDLLGELATQLESVSPPAAAHCLQILSAQGDDQSLAVLCEILKRGTLEDEQSVAIALSPLFQWPPPGLPLVYELLGEDAWRWQLLGGLLDLAGHGLRKGKLARHPLASNTKRLRDLLNSTVARLSRLEANPQQFGDDVTTIQQVLHNAIALTVSLCDTLGLLGDHGAVDALTEAMELSHRRIQTEAAGALARLDNQAGLARLKELVQDPASRLRALAYLDEMNIDDAELDDWRQPVALAEAEVVCWLAAPERFGVPPASLELVDERTQYWPSYEEPQACFLYRFTYHFTQGDLTNLIIAGPLVYAFQADLRRLPHDDVYAIFAGWQAEHSDIYEVPRAAFNPSQLQEAERLLDAPSHQGIDDLHVLGLTFFFGERAVLATGMRQGQTVAVVSDGLETLVMACDQRPTGMTPDLVLALYRGRKLLRSFNS